MLLVLSPAKSLDFTPPPDDSPASERGFAPETRSLIRTARQLTRAELRALMDISAPLADLNHKRFKAFEPDSLDGVQAAFAFAGDVYDGLDARSLRPGALNWLQLHVRILSGLYGLLRPLDRIQPYRLEMGVRLKTRRGHTLYDFWGDTLARGLTRASAELGGAAVVNLASQEYFAAVQRKTLKAPVVSLRFLEEKDGEARIISFFAKKARGLAARWAAEQGAECVEDLKGFDLAGYRFVANASTPQTFTFVRPQPAPAAGRAGGLATGLAAE